MNFKEWMAALRRVKGFKTKEERKEEELKDQIEKAKTIDELLGILRQIDTTSPSGFTLSLRVAIRATDMRFENLEKRVSKLEKGKEWISVDGGKILQ